MGSGDVEPALRAGRSGERARAIERNDEARYYQSHVASLYRLNRWLRKSDNAKVTANRLKASTMPLSIEIDATSIAVTPVHSVRSTDSRDGSHPL
jgi:hypothetical protein